LGWVGSPCLRIETWGTLFGGGRGAGGGLEVGEDGGSVVAEAGGFLGFVLFALDAVALPLFAEDLL
jgi:hypothetical protein